MWRAQAGEKNVWGHGRGSLLWEAGNAPDTTSRPVTRGRRRFSSLWRPARAEQHRENDEHLRTRRDIRAAKERRDIQTRIACRLPRDRWANHETVERIVACILVGEITILHLDTRLEPFVLEPNRNHRALRKTPLAPPIKTDFLLEKPVHCPFDSLAEILRQQKSKLIRVRHFGFCFRLHRSIFVERLNVEVSASRHFFHSHFFFRWPLLVQDATGVEFVFGKQRRIQWDLVPIGERIPRFDAEALVLEITIKAFLIDFESEPEAIRQSDFDFFSEEMIRRSMTERVALIN